MMKTSRRAFSLIELIVVIAIIAIVAALTLPAIFTTRESARRTGCINNLRQLGLAFQNYHDSHNQLPPVYTGIRKQSGSVLPQFFGVQGHADDLNIHTYAEFLLPHFEQGNLYNEINFSEPFFAPADMSSIGLPNYKADNQAAVQTSLPIFLCPSTPRENGSHDDVWTDAAFSIPFRTGANDYGPSSGIGFRLKPLASPLENTLPEGVLSNNHIDLGFEHVTDGLSNTALMWEIAGRPDLWNFGTPMDSKTTGGGWADFSNAENWFNGSELNGSVCAINCTNETDGGVYSFHQSGVNVLLCDGTVHFLNEQTSIATFVSLVTYDGNVPVSIK